jgi:hypothetical protein
MPAIFRAACERQQAEVALDAERRRGLLERASDGLDLRGAEAHALGMAGAARRVGDLCGAPRQWLACGGVELAREHREAGSPRHAGSLPAGKQFAQALRFVGHEAIDARVVQRVLNLPSREETGQRHARQLPRM